MAILCSQCAELLPDIGTGDGKCPHCGLGHPGSGAPLRALPGQNQEPLTGRDLQKWKQERANQAAFHASKTTFALLGLGGWEGPRWVGSSRSGSGETDKVELVHGTRTGLPRAEVTTIAKLGDGPGYSLRSHLEDLLWSVWNDEEEGLEFVQSVHRDASLLALWGSTMLNVNGQILDAHYVKMGQSYVTVAETNEMIISVVSAGIALAEIKLVDVDARRYSDVSR